MKELFFVFLGSGTGGVIRFLSSKYLPLFLTTKSFPLATLFVNVLAAFIFGFLAVLITPQQKNAELLKLLFLTGFCGGLSTFSTFTNELYQLKSSGMVAFAYIVASISLCFLFLIVGMNIGKKIF